MFDIDTIILKETPIGIIIGRNTMKKYRLLDRIQSQLLRDEPSEVSEGITPVR